MDSTPLLMTGFMLAALSASTSAELKPLDDTALAQVVGQAGLSINVQTRLQAGEIRYSQHNNDGSERGSISIKNLDIFGIGDASTVGDAGPGDSTFAALSRAIDDPSQRSFAELGIDEFAVRDLSRLINTFGGDIDFIDCQGVVVDGPDARFLPDSQFNTLRILDPGTGEGLTSSTFSIDIGGTDSPGGSALQIALPQLTRLQQVILPEAEKTNSGLINGTVLSTLLTINFALEFDLAINDTAVGSFLVRDIIGLDTLLSVYGRTGGESGLNLDALLGIGFGELVYEDSDTSGGQLSLLGVRIGQVATRPTNTASEGTALLRRDVLGAPLLGLTLDAETRELVDLTTGLSREATVLRLGLPDVQNLDLTVDNIRIGEGNLGGFEILDINTLVDNNRVLELNQRFGYNIAPGTGTGVDALGQAANGYQLNGELLLSGTADNSLQFNGQWGGQIGSIRYYDSLEGEQGQLALNDISVFNTAQDEQGNTLLIPAEFQGTLTLTPQGVEFGNLNAQGSIAIQSVTVGQSNLGAFLIDNFQLRNSHITISGK